MAEHINLTLLPPKAVRLRMRQGSFQLSVHAFVFWIVLGMTRIRVHRSDPMAEEKHRQPRKLPRGLQKSMLSVG
jgi:hypothetical protein